MLSALLFMTTLATVGAPADVKFAIVDLNRALNSVEEGKTAASNLEGEAKKKEEDIRKREKELEGLHNQFQELERKAQSLPLSDAEQKKRGDLMQKIQKLMKEGAEVSEKYRREMGEKKFTTEQDIIRKLRVIVEDLSRSAGYTLVFDKTESGLIYAAQADDLTERVIQKYNSQYSKKK